ncbi:phenylalanine--tRNA ligase subunit beta [archaeon]|jgi:phenylalanyl-tRNA synthetase beta chain|nr:phenylalanine--tRNA ligase subunit beta [archaeon]
MANIKIPRKEFEKDIGKLTKEMQMKIALFGTTLESFDDNEIELEIFPNRPDLLSYQGFKRSFLAFLGKNTGLKKYKVFPKEKNYKIKVDSNLKNIRPHTACAIIKNLKLNDEKIKEIIEIQEKLHTTIGRRRKKIAIGIYPLEKIKLPITFKALEPDQIRFQPLESKKEMTGLEILQRHPTGRDYAHLLAGKIKFPIFIDSNKEILSMPPIINSEKVGRVTKKTKEVFIECSGFDQETLEKCLNILVTTFADMGGKIYQMEINSNLTTPNLEPEKTKISIKNVNKLLGLDLEEKTIKQLLGKMGHEYNNGIVKSPSYRTDLLHEVDLIEDIAIAYGYENFEPIIPKISTIGKENFQETIKRKISSILTNIEFLEISNYHLTAKKDQFTKMGIPEKQEKGAIEIAESKTEYNLLRKDLTHYLLKILSENIDSEYPQKIFEIGKTFSEDLKETEHLSCAITPGNFTDIKQSLEYLNKMTGLNLILKEPTKIPDHFIDGRVAKIILDEKIIGYLGEIHPKILKNWKIKMPVALFEISLKEIFEKLKE